MKLYHNPRSRSTRPNWLLEEIGLDAERVSIDFAKGEQKSPEYLAINPLGQLPAWTEGETTITESLAICLYLADVHGPHLVPPPGPGRAAYYRWMVYPVGTLEPRMMEVFHHKAGGDTEKMTEAKAKLDASVAVVADAFGEGPWLLGEQFTAADIMLGSTLMWLSMMGQIELPPVLQGWTGRIMQRPAWQRAFAASGG